MTDQPPRGKSSPEIPVPANKSEANGSPAEIGQPPPVNQLTPAEQMALFEKELKEKDWGHQPC